jgi:phage terminase small subunit
MKISQVREDTFWAEYKRCGSVSKACQVAGLGWSQKMETFCLKYFERGNASEAARLSLYSPHTAAVIGRQNLLKPQIQARIQELRQKVEDASVMNVLERKQRLSVLGRANVTDFLDEDGAINIKGKVNTGAIAEITTRTKLFRKAGEPVVITNIKLHNPVPPIEVINKMDKVYSDAPPAGNTTNNTMNIFVIDGETKDLISQVKERTGKLLNADENH